MNLDSRNLIGLLVLSCASACSGFGASMADALAGKGKDAAGEPDTGSSGADTGGSGGAGETPADAQGEATVSSAMDAPSDASTFPYSCNDLGPEPTLPPACTTLVATRTLTNGKPTDESTPDTKLIQDAINACPPGQSVKLAADGDNAAFVSGPLFMIAGVSLWIDVGVTLFATRSTRDFDAGRAGLCGSANISNSACYALINVGGDPDVSIVGAGTIDGRGGEPVIIADGGGPSMPDDASGPVTGVDGGAPTWWDLENASDGTMAGPRLIQVSNSPNFTLYQVTLRNSPKFHVVIERTNGFRVWGITVNTPANSPNTDGVDPSVSTNGIIAYNKITTGDDNIAIKGGGPGLVDHLVIAHNQFARGHGMSIGSETDGGVRNVEVCDLSLDGAQNGIRIKSDRSRGGLVQNITYSDICMRGVSNPLVFDPFYDRTATGITIPDYRDILVRNLHVLGGGMLTVRGYDAAHALGLTLDNVVFDTDPRFRASSPSNANVTLGPGPVTFGPLFDAATADAGAMVTVKQLDQAAAEPHACGDEVWATF
jgi:polygalacturonase